MAPKQYQPPTLPGTIDPTVARAIHDLVRELNTLAANYAALEARVTGLPPVLTLDEIKRGLQAGGPAPLNLTGLVGASQTP